MFGIQCCNCEDRKGKEAPLEDLSGYEHDEHVQTTQLEIVQSSAGPKKEKPTEERKSELQDLLKSFSRDAITGISCKLFRGSAVPPYLAAIFCLDNALTKITITTGGKTQTIALQTVLDAYSYDDAMDKMPGHLLVQKIGDQEANTSVFIRYKQKDSEPEQLLCLVLPDQAEHERFVTCVKILSIYSQGH